MTVARTVRRLRASHALRAAARLGLVSRGLFYLLLAYLAAALAAGHSVRGSQVNANGALRAVSATPLGLVALGAAAVGFAAFGLIRLVGAYGDASTGRFRRLTTAGQAFFYLVMAATTAVFLLGRHTTGSAQQQDSTTAALLQHPVGRAALLGVGVGVVVVCGWQTWIALRGGFSDSLATGDAAPAMRRTITWVGTVGILARAAVAAPIGVLMVLAAVRSQAGDAKDLDQLLAGLNHSTAGHALVWVTAAGFVVFAVYSLLEARYRTVHAGD